MKIIYVSAAVVPSRTANSIHIMKMCDAFEANGHSVILFTANDKRIQQESVQNIHEFYGVENKFKIVRLPLWRFPGGRYLLALVPLLYYIFWRPDVLYGRYRIPALLSTRLGFKTGFEAHSLSNITSSDNTKNQMQRIFDAKSFTKLVVTSKTLKDDVLEAFDISDNKVMYAHNGADSEQVKPSLQLDSSKFHVGYIGHLYEGKGMEIVFPLIEKCPFAQFHIIGGTEKDVKFWNDKLGGLPNVTLHGYVKPSEVAGYRASMDALLAPYQENVKISSGIYQSARWMTPIKLFEYMASGKPSISSDLPVAKEVVEDGVDGFLCGSSDLDSWATKLKFLYENPESRKSIGEKARAKFEENFSWRNRAERIVNFLNKG